MTTSDSEAYESADEDLKEESFGNTVLSKVPSKNPANSSGSSENVETVGAKAPVSRETPDVPRKSNTQKANKRQESERKPKEVVKLGMKVDKSNLDIKPSISTSPQDEKPHDTSQADDGWEDFDIETSETDQNIIYDSVEDKVIEANDKVIESNKECDGQGDEGWDFDDWGDDDIQSHVAVKPETARTEQEYKQLADKLSSLGNSGAKDSTPQSGWGGWGEWGASLITSGVSQLTTHVSQGLNTVSNVIESGIGAPDPEELVRIQKESKLRREEQMRKDMSQESSVQKEAECEGEGERRNQENVGGFQLGKLVSSVTKLVETTGSTVITGGLDTLEEIGKRTMKVIQGDEPGGRVKLSTLLREAKDRKEEQDASAESFPIKRSPRFEVLFDDFQGLVHLEALEMLSKQCDIKIQTLTGKYHGNELKEFQETLEQVKEICELLDYEDDFNNKNDVESFHQRLIDATKDLGIQLNFELILTCWKELHEDINKSKDISDDATPNPDNSEDEIENVSCLAIKHMAQFSALSVQLLHKCAALLSVRERRSTADEADGLTQLTAILSHHIGEIANVYTNKLNQLSEQSDQQDKASSAMTSIYLEAEKGSSYVKDAFLLTIPILQVGAT